MSQSIDLLTTVAKFLETHDDLVEATSELSFIPLMKLQRMGFLIDEMYVNHDCIGANPTLILRTPPVDAYVMAETHPFPHQIAAVILHKDPVDVMNVIRGLMFNPHWASEDDELLVAIRLLNYTLDGPYDSGDDFETKPFENAEMMKSICRYDCVMRSYSNFKRDPLVDFAGHIYGRSLAEMFELIEGNDHHLFQLAKLCVNVDVTIEMIAKIDTNPRRGNDIQGLISNSPLNAAGRKSAFEFYLSH